MSKYIMAMDAGTTSNRCILFNKKGQVCSVAQREFTQYFPHPGWVEHDADEIWACQLGVAVEAMNKIGASAEDIAAIGITNQRETAIVWDRKTGEPVYNAIVWQCRRTSEYCDSLKEKGLTEKISSKNGSCNRRLFFRHKDQMDTGQCPRSQRTCRTSGTSFRHSGDMAHLENDKRTGTCNGLLQCFPYDAV